VTLSLEVTDIKYYKNIVLTITVQNFFSCSVWPQFGTAFHHLLLILVHLQDSDAFWSLSSDRQHLSYDVCLEVREKIIRTVLCCIKMHVLKLCTVISTLRWAVLTVLWIGFCHTGPASLNVDLFLFISVYFVCFCCIVVVLFGERWGGPDGNEV